jgi:hypothetical protein
MNEKVPVLRRAETQAEAGPLMPMMRRANMRLSLAAGRRNRKGLAAESLEPKGSGRTEGFSRHLN